MTGLLLAFFGFVMLGATAAGYFFLRMDPAGVSPEPAVVPLTGSHRSPWKALLLMLGQAIHRPGRASEDLRKMLFRAGYRDLDAMRAFHGLQMALGLTLALAVGVAVAQQKGHPARALVTALCAGGFGFLVPSRLLEWQMRSRARRIRASVPSALDLICLAIEAGQTLELAIQDTAFSLRHVHPDLTSELSFCSIEIRAGTSRTEALRRLAERCGEDEVKKLAAVLIDGERFGTTLGPALRTHAHYLRARMRQRAQTAARQLGVKLVVPVFFLIFPAVILVTLGPAYLQLRSFLDTLLK